MNTEGAIDTSSFKYFPILPKVGKKIQTKTKKKQKIQKSKKITYVRVVFGTGTKLS